MKKPYDIKLFNWKEGEGVIEASDLSWDSDVPNGFAVCNNKTKVIHHFFRDKPAELDREGEVTLWTYVSEDKRFKIIVFND